MLSLASTLFGRGLPLAGSLVVHAGVVLAFGGHALPSRTASPLPSSEVEIAVVESAVAIAKNEVAAPTPKASPRAHTHTHPYPVRADHDAQPHDAAAMHTPIAASAPAPVFAMSAPSAPQAFKLAVHAPTVGAASPGAGVRSFAGDDVPGEAGVDSLATLLHGHVPAYPREAAEASVEADVPLEIVVDEHGRVLSARLLSRATHGLGEAALSGVRAYRFRPAVLHGRATPVRMKWVVQFRLQ